MTRARELARLANENVFTAEDYNSPVEVGINSTSPSSTLDVRGDLKVGTAIQAGTAGVITATEFSGSIGTFSGAGSFGGNLDVTGNVTIGGTLTYEDVTNIDVIGIVTAQNGVNISGGQLLVGSGVTIGNAGVATFSGTSDIHLRDNVQLNVGDGSDHALFHNGSSTRLEGTVPLYIKGSNIVLYKGGGTNKFAEFTGDSGAYLFYNASKKWETTNDGTVTTGIATATGGLTISADSKNLAIGAGEDLKLYHNGSHSFIENGTGALVLKGTDVNIQSTGGVKSLYAYGSGIELNYSGNKKFETTNDGTVTTGIATASNFTSSGTILIDANGYSEASSDGDDLIIGSTSDTAKGLSIVGSTSGGIGNIFFSDGASYKNQGNIQYRHADDSMRFSANQNEAIRIMSSGKVGIGTTNADNLLHLESSSNVYIQLEKAATSSKIYLGNVSGKCVLEATGGAIELKPNNASNKFILDTSGRLLIGQTAGYDLYANGLFQVSATDGTASLSVTRWSDNGSSPYINLGKSRGAIGAYTIVQEDDRLGQINFTGADGTDLASPAAGIAAYVDGTPGSNDMPGRLVFFTASDGGVAETERLRISSDAGVELTGHSQANFNALGNSSGTVTIDFTTANYISCTLTGTTTFANPTTESIGQSGSIVITQDGTGSRTASWGSQFKWVGGTAPTLTTTAAAVDRIDYLVVAADTIHCVASLDVK